MQSRNQSPFRPESPFFDDSSSAMHLTAPQETTSLAQIDMWRTAIPGSRLTATFQSMNTFENEMQLNARSTHASIPPRVLHESSIESGIL